MSESGLIQRFDHLVHAVRDLPAAMAMYRRRGFDVRPGGRHPGRGTHNAIIRFGLDYLELISIHDRSELEAAGRAQGLAAFLDRHAEGLAAFALATRDIDGLARRFRATGLEAVGPFAMDRLRPDGRRLSWRLLIPGGEAYRRPWPFFIQWDLPDAERLQWEGPASHPNGARALEEVMVAVHDLGAGVDLYQRLGLSLAGRTPLPALGATSARFDVSGVRILLLAPGGPGAVADSLQDRGEGPFRAHINLACAGGLSLPTDVGN